MTALAGTGVLGWSLAGAPGIGPAREKAAWLAGGWDRARLPAVLPELGLKGERLGAVLGFVSSFDNALQCLDLKSLWALLPARERWRCIPLALERAAFVDIETDGGMGPGCITAVAVRTRDAAECWLRGANPARMLELITGSQVLVTFNGTTFDLPLMRVEWPGVTWPAVHVDLVHTVRRLKVTGGLKVAEQRAGWTRPPHLAHLRGFDAIGLWARWAEGRDSRSLQVLCEYNMEDVWSLPNLAAWLHDELAQRAAQVAAGAPVPGSALQTWHGRADAGPMMLDAVRRAINQAHGGMNRI